MSTKTTELQKRFNALLEPTDFKAGDLVEWKPGLINKGLPKNRDPAIVIEILAEPIFDSENSSGCSYFREPLNIILGIIDDDDIFVVHYYDSRRFQHYQP